jgi:hypothetical protein
MPGGDRYSGLVTPCNDSNEGAAKVVGVFCKDILTNSQYNEEKDGY